jgi:hypothetical protein
MNGSADIGDTLSAPLNYPADKHPMIAFGSAQA